MNDQSFKIGNHTLYNGMYDVLRRNTNRPDTILGVLIVRSNGLEWTLKLRGSGFHNSDFHSKGLTNELPSILGVEIKELVFSSLGCI